MAAVPPSLQDALADRYQLERIIGQGGMATVYLARDRKHNRDVAVKVLRPDLAATIGAERFLREIQIAARLQHPHILLLIDSGNAGGHLHYVMPFVTGESLRGRLERRGVLGPDEALAIARQVASALEHAHRHGVVHRDIKPENILLTDGHAFVADFGIAKAVSEATDRSLTKTGNPVGTIGYMSPEQAAGFDELDARSDVFSLACVLYEMVVGRVPGFWPSDEATRLRRFVDAPAAHRERLDRLPGSVEQVLVGGLGLRPDQRFASPMALVESFATALGEKPRFSDPEARAIVARAAQLEAITPTQPGTLSLGGIQQIAAEVGIAPEHVERAARHAQARPEVASGPVNPLLGAPTSIVAERYLGGELDVDHYASLVDEVQVALRVQGHSSMLGRSLTWRTMLGVSAAGRNISLTVTPSDGRTRIRLEEVLTPSVAGIHGSVVGGLGSAGVALSIGIGIGVAGNVAGAVAVAVSLFGGSVGLARAAFRYHHRQKTEELGRLADRLQAFAEDTLRQGKRRLPGQRRSS